MSNLAVKVEGLTKVYRLGEIGSGTLRQDFQNWVSKIRGQGGLAQLKMNSELSSDLSIALEDLSFVVNKGDVLGVIGRNGAGKSTLLKILSKITRPTRGNVYLDGKVASLLEIGTGFHPDLTGRENIYMNGAILGMSRREINLKFNDIVEFSGVGKYLDTPVKRYSSGMYMRLAFSVIAFLEPEILVIDEVLAVGDLEFQQKCIGRINDVSKNDGRTVLFVSHNMDAIRQLCNKSILLNNGRLVQSGVTTDVLKSYVESQFESKNNNWTVGESNKALPYIASVSIELKGDQPDLALFLTAVISSPPGNFKNANIAFDIKNGLGSTIMQAIPEIEPFINFSGEPKTIVAKIQLQGLIPDRYYVSVWVGSHNTETYDWVQDVVSFEVIHSPTPGRVFPHTLDHGSIVPKSEILVGT
jgi:lipopolysaccharide transport system ATP-binding protein